MLEPLGVAARAEDTYRALLKAGPVTTGRLADLLGAGPDEVDAALRELHGLNLVRRDPGTPDCWHAESPEVTLASLVVQQQETLLERQRELDRVQAAVADLVRLSRSRGPGPALGVVEPVTDPAAARRRCAYLIRSVERQVLSLDKPSCVPEATGAPAAAEIDDHLALLDRGIEVRAVYERPALLEPGRFESLRRLVTAGEQARTVPSVPLKLMVFDGTAAVVHTVDSPDPAAPAALFVHPSDLLNGLVALFQLVWDRAVPVPPSRDDESPAPEGCDEVLVALLAAGFKDESIARHLGISASTVTRRMARLMEQTGTSTRFQLGMQAVRQGWI
jgi:predicted transcriptional regulator